MKFPMLRLVTAEGHEQVYEITDDEVLIGRKSDTDIVLVDPYVSRNHAKIVRQDLAYSLVDLKSTHGTFVNGQRIEQHRLEHGDQIRLGRLEMLFATRSLDDSHGGSSTAPGEDFLERSLTQLTSIFSSAGDAEHSDLEKITSILDFQYQWEHSFSADRTFRQILKSALDISGAERGFVLSKTEDGFEYAVGFTGQQWASSQSDFRASQTVVHQVADTGEAVFMDKELDEKFANQDSIVDMDLRAAACLPLRGISFESDEPDLLGILYLDSTHAMHALSGLDQKILSKLAAEAGNVLEKLELIKSSQERRKFEQELEVAYHTQKSLLPRSLPEFEGFSICAFSEPTRYVGGDFYDFLQPKPDELVGVLADVSGKGIPAALLSSLLQGALDMECRSSTPLEEVLNRINLFLWERSAPNHFVTLFLFSLNTKGEGEFVSAGHNPAYVFRATSGEIEELTSDGLILGAFDSATYQSRPLRLGGGDLLVIYSDGVTDAANHEGELFGEDRLRDIVKTASTSGAEALEKTILDSVEQFTEGMAQTDDITFTLIEMKK